MAAAQTDLGCLLLNSTDSSRHILCPFRCSDEPQRAGRPARWQAAAPSGRADLKESRPERLHQILPVVYVVTAAKPKWIIDQHGCSYILHNCCSIASVNCIPIGQLLGQQHERDPLNSPRWPLPAAASQLRLACITAQDLSHTRVCVCGMANETMKAKKWNEFVQIRN